MTEPNLDDAIPEPDNTYGRVLYEAIVSLPAFSFVGWECEPLVIRMQLVEAAKPVIQAYDDYLTGKADAYAVAVAEAPTFIDHLRAAMEADDAAKTGT